MDVGLLEFSLKCGTIADCACWGLENDHEQNP